MFFHSIKKILVWKPPELFDNFVLKYEIKEIIEYFLTHEINNYRKSFILHRKLVVK